LFGNEIWYVKLKDVGMNLPTVQRKDTRKMFDIHILGLSTHVIWNVPNPKQGTPKTKQNKKKIQRFRVNPNYMCVQHQLLPNL